MATDGGHEGEVVAGYGIELYLTNANNLLAQLMRTLRDLETAAASRPVVVPLSIGGTGGGTGGGGTGGIAGAARTMADQIKLAFQGIGTAGDLTTALRDIRGELERLTADAERAGQALTISLRGPSGEGAFTLSGKKGVGDFISKFPEYASAVGASDRPVTGMDRPSVMKLGVSAGVRDTPEAMADVAAARTRLGTVTSLTTAEEAAGRMMRRTTEEGDKLSKWLELWASGGRPQRAIAAFAQGPLTSMFGAEVGAAMSGLVGMIGGGALFHMGWAITDMLARIPAHIGEYVASNQRLDVMRAGQIATPAGPDNLKAPPVVPFNPNAASGDTELMAKLGGGAMLFNRLGSGTEAPKAFASTLSTLQTGSNKLPLNDDQRRIWMQRNARFASMATFGNLFAGTGDPLTVANALQQMQMTESPEAMQTLLNQPGMKKIMVDAERKKYGLTNWTNEAVWSRLTQRLTGLWGIDSPNPATRAGAREQVYNAFGSMIQNPSALAQAQTAIGQNHPLTSLSELWSGLFGTKEKLSNADLTFIASYSEKRRGGMSAEDALRRMARDPVPNKAELGYDHISREPTARERRLQQLGEGWSGAFGPMLGGTPKPFEAQPLGQPASAFISLVDFARNMQTAAGVHMTDYAEKTATSSTKTAENTGELLQYLKGRGDAQVW